MLSLLWGVVWGLLTNPAVLGVVLAVIALLTGLWFLGGPVMFYKFVSNTKTWLVVAVIAGIFGYSHMQTKLAKAEQKIEQAASHDRAKGDSNDVVLDNKVQKGKRAAQKARHQEVIHNADPGEEIDDLLDEIARDQGVPDARPGDGKPVPGSVPDGSGRILP